MQRHVALAALLLATAACPRSADTAKPDDGAKDPVGTPPVATVVTPEDFAAVLAMPHRTAENRARDVWRHPAETLAFFGVEPDDTVVELWPGGGWYTEILAPYLANDGKLIVTVFDPAGPTEYYGTAQSQKLLERAKAEAAVFGQLGTATVKQTLEIGPDGKVAKTTIHDFELAPAESVDAVLTFRNSHGWYRNGALPVIYGAAFRALKPGGTLGIEQHRAPAGSDPEQTAKTGYLSEASVIATAEAAGFELVERSEINANPKDTHDHPDGVWSLPPSLSGGDKDRDKFVAIGESDRMTLKFRKPAK